MFFAKKHKQTNKKQKNSSTTVNRHIPATKARLRALSHYSTPGGIKPNSIGCKETRKRTQTLKPDVKENGLRKEMPAPKEPKGILPRRPTASGITQQFRHIKRHWPAFIQGTSQGLAPNSYPCQSVMTPKIPTFHSLTNTP